MLFLTFTFFIVSKHLVSEQEEKKSFRAGKISCVPAACAAIVNHMVNLSATLDTVFSALADPTRRRILQGLMRGGAPVGDVAQPFNVSAPAISRHLRVLERTGLIRRTVRGRRHEIALNAEPLRRATDWLETYRNHWESSLDSLANYLESAEPSPSKKHKSKTKGKIHKHK
jgi:DNA-binding transcriptional ArsR family regulator